MSDIEIMDARPGEPFQSPTEAQDDGTTNNDNKPNTTSKLGFLLDEADEKKVAKRIYKGLWSSVEKAAKNRHAMWEVNEERRDGNPHVRLKKQIDEDVYTVYRPHGSENAPPGLNKTDDLCNKVVSQVLADPPAPECQPNSDEDDDKDRAEFSTKVLEDILAESGINGGELVREAEDLACTYWSGFVVPWTDPFGGGWRPRELMASMAATTVEDAVFTQGGQAPADNGMEPAEPTEPVSIPQPEPYVIRYVAKDGKSLTDEPSEADIEWVPKIKAEVVTGKNVRMFPAGSDIRTADCVIIAKFLPLGDIKARYDTVAKMSPEDQRKMCGFRPEQWKHLLPKGIETNPTDQVDDQTKAPADDTLACLFFTYYRSCPSYKFGATVVSSGETFVLNKGTWTMKVERKGKTHEVPMDLPVAQFRQFKDTTRARDPYGRGMVDKVGDGDPLLAMAMGALIEYLPKALNPHIFVPIGSGIDSKSMQLPRGTPIPYLGSVGVPVQEQMPQFPAEAMELYDRVNSLMNSRSGLEDAAQGVNTPDVTSGRHAAQVVEQALVALKGVKGGMEDGYVRLCRVLLQLVKRDYTMPMKLKLTGAGGRRRVKEWSATELGDTSDVTIRAGTSTMLSVSAKAAMAKDEFELTSAIDPKGALEKYHRATAGKIAPALGLTEDPATEEIKDQIEDWKEGPPEQWKPVQAPIDPSTGQPPIDPATGQPLPPPTDPANPFLRRPHHMEQDVAVKRHDELKRSMATADFQKHPPEWQQLFVAEYEAMRQAGGIQTVQEQQAAQQAQMQQQQQMQMAQKGPQADPAQQAQAQQEQQQAQMQAQQQQKEMELGHQAQQADQERQVKVSLAQQQMEQQAAQAEADRQSKLQLQANEHAIKQRELDAPIEVAQAQAKEITGGILPVVQQTVAAAIEQAVQHLTLMQQNHVQESHAVVQQGTQALAGELANQRRMLQTLAQAVQAPVVIHDEAKEKETVNVTVEMPKPKKKTVRFKKGADGVIEGEVTEEGGGTQHLKLHKDKDGEMVGTVESGPEPMKKIKKKGK